MKIVLHIGSTKTGSSAIQAYLNSNRQQLLNAGVYYPEQGVVSGGHHLLAAALHPTAKGLHEEYFASEGCHPHETFQKLYRQIRSKAQEHNAHTIFLSSEYLWGVFDQALYDGWREMFAQDEVAILALLRRPDDWLQSTYMQNVKHGEKRDFDSWYADFKSSAVSGSNYYEVLSSWEANIPKSIVRLEDYEVVLKSEDFFREFLALAIDTTSLNLSASSSRVNPSPSRESLDLLLAVNRSDIEHSLKQRIRKVLLSAGELRQIGQTLSIIPNETRLTILNSYVEQNKKILEKFYNGTRPNMFISPWPSL